MTSRTHDLATLTLLNVVFILFPIPSMSLATALVALAAAFIGGLTPDIDRPGSAIWQKIPAGNLLGRLLQPFLGAHRHLSHSLLGAVLLAIGANYLLHLLNPVLLVDITIVWWAFVIGLAAHIFMDLLTVEGLPLLFPLSIRFGFPPLRFLRLKTGSWREKFIIFPAMVLANIYLVIVHYSQYLNFFHSLIN